MKCEYCLKEIKSGMWCDVECFEKYSQRKKDKDDGSNVSLSGDTKEIQGKKQKDEHMLVGKDTHAEISNIKRQGLIVTVFELRIIADELEAQVGLNNIENIPTHKDTRFQINIINNTPECSDTWIIEDSQFIKSAHSEVEE